MSWERNCELTRSDLLQGEGVLLFIDPLCTNVNIFDRLFTSLSIPWSCLFLTSLRAKLFHLLWIRAFESFGWRHFLLARCLLVDNWSNVSVDFELTHEEHLLAIEWLLSLNFAIWALNLARWSLMNQAWGASTPTSCLVLRLCCLLKLVILNPMMIWWCYVSWCLRIEPIRNMLALYSLDYIGGIRCLNKTLRAYCSRLDHSLVKVLIGLHTGALIEICWSLL